MTVKQITVEEFQRHCAEELKQVTSGALSLQLTDHGKVVAVIDPADTMEATGVIRDVVGPDHGVNCAPDFVSEAPTTA